MFFLCLLRGDIREAKEVKEIREDIDKTLKLTKLPTLLKLPHARGEFVARR